MPILGTSPDMIDLAEDRDRFKMLLERLKLRQPENGTARSLEDARAIVERIGYPVVIRPSYVLGGRAMEIVRDPVGLERYMADAVVVSGTSPVLDRFLSLRRDRGRRRRALRRRGCLRLRRDGAHRGGGHPFRRFRLLAAAAFAAARDDVAEIERQTVALAKALHVGGLMNVQYAVKDGDIYVLEVNPRASRTVPFVAKAIGIPIAKIAAKVMAGAKLARLQPREAEARNRYR